MKKLYLDYNIFEEVNKDENFKTFIENVKEYDFYYSGAHAEELFKSKKNSKDGTIQYVQETKFLIEELARSKKIIPNIHDKSIKNGLIKYKESLDKCLIRIARDDNSAYVDDKSVTRFFSGKANYTRMREEDITLSNITNISPEGIWENSYIKDAIEAYNKIMNEIVYFYNNGTSNKIARDKYNFIVNIPGDYQLKKNSYYDIKKNYHLLELTIEFLHFILTENGYCKEKNEHAAISGVHDISHSIYATYCDVFVTKDLRLKQRSEAIYKFLNINTKILTLDDFRNEILNR